jgi:hypothetical protein
VTGPDQQKEGPERQKDVVNKNNRDKSKGTGLGGVKLENFSKMKLKLLTNNRVL